jgi:hypothetical protein
MSQFKLLFIFSLISFSAFAQDEKAIEKDLVNCFKKRAAYNDSIIMGSNIAINPTTGRALKDTTDPLVYVTPIVPVDTVLANKVLYYTSKFPVTLTMDFQLLRTQDVNIIISDDSLFRIYVWEEQHNMVGRFYRSVFQYKAGDKVKSCLLPHPDTAITGASQAFYDAIYTLTANNKTYYLATYINKYTPTNREEGIKIFTIDSARVRGKAKYWLNDTVHLFKTKTGLHNELSYKYDVIASGDAGSDNGIAYDTIANEFQIPIVTETGKMTEMTITYKFKGQYFERVVDKPKPVNPPIRKKKTTK